MKKCCLPLIFLIIFFQPNLVFAAAWTKNKGSSQFINTFSGYSSNSYFDREGNSQSSYINMQKTEINTFAEYGLSDDKTIGFNLSMQNWIFEKKDRALAIYDFRQCGFYNDGNLNTVNASISELDFFLRKKIWDKDNLVLSLQPLIKAPCLVNESGQMRFMENTADAELRFLAGYGFKWEPKNPKYKNKPFAGQNHFVNLETAYRKRSSQFADQLRIDGTVGFHYNEETLLLAQLFSIFGVEDEAVRGRRVGNVLFVEKDNFYTVKAQLSGVRQVTEKISLQLGIFNEFLGKNAGNGSGASISVWYDF